MGGLCCFRNVYYKAKSLALDNGHDFHVAAILFRNKSIIRYGVNSTKTHPKFVRDWGKGDQLAHLHAEMDVVRFAKPGDIVVVVRFQADGTLTMAKPCPHCQFHLRKEGIKCVYYSDWNGDFKRMDFNG